MNTHAGYSKKTLTNTNVLLAGGGDKSLADFLGGIQYVSASHKILYRAADTNTWSDLVTLVTTDENVKQTPKTDNVNRPLMMINGGTSSGELTSTSIFSVGMYANTSTNLLTTAGFVKIGSDDTYILLGGGGHILISDLTAGAATKVTVRQNVTSDNDYPIVWSNKNNTSNSTANLLYKSYSDLVYNPSSKKLTVGGNIYAAHYYESSDINKKDHIEVVSKHIRKYVLKSTGKAAYGVIALEVPEMFRDGKEGNMTVNYNSVLCYYISILENKVKELEDRLSKLEK